MLKLVFITDSNILINKKFGAVTCTFMVFVRPKHKDNKHYWNTNLHTFVNFGERLGCHLFSTC